MNSFRKAIKEDAFRYTGVTVSYYRLYRTIPGVRFCFWLRLCKWLRGEGNSSSGFRIVLAFLPIAKWRLKHYSIKYGISIPYTTSVGEGFYIGHFGGIVVNGLTKIGRNVNISTGVVIGQSNRGDKMGVPVIGNEVYIGPGAKIFGKITVGNNVAIGANAVVTSDIPDNSVVAGMPAHIISNKGAEGYVCNKI